MANKRKRSRIVFSTPDTLSDEIEPDTLATTSTNNNARSLAAHTLTLRTRQRRNQLSAHTEVRTTETLLEEGLVGDDVGEEYIDIAAEDGDEENTPESLKRPPVRVMFMLTM